MPVFNAGARVEACCNGVWYMGIVVRSKSSEWTVQCDVDKLGCVVTTGFVRACTGTALANPGLNAKEYATPQATCLAMFKPELAASAPTRLAASNLPPTSPLSRTSGNASRSRRTLEQALSPGPARKPDAAQPGRQRMLHCKHSPGPRRKPVVANQTTQFSGAPTLIEQSGVQRTLPVPFQSKQVHVPTGPCSLDPMLEPPGNIWSQMACSENHQSLSKCATQSSALLAQQSSSASDQEALEQATEICELSAQPLGGQPTMRPVVPQQQTSGGTEASEQATDVCGPSSQPAGAQPAVQNKEVAKDHIQPENQLFARWMFESSLAKAGRERMTEGVQRTLDFKGPAWMEDAPRFGGSSMSVAGFNNGYNTASGSESREYGSCNLERNFREAMEALNSLHRPWSVMSPPVMDARSPITGWISWDAAERAPPPDSGTGACSAGDDIESSPFPSPSPFRSPVAKTALEAVQMGLLEFSTETAAAEDAELSQVLVHRMRNDSGISAQTMLPEAEPESCTERGDSFFSTETLLLGTGAALCRAGVQSHRTEQGESGLSVETLMPGTDADLHQAGVQDIQMGVAGLRTHSMPSSVADSLAASSSTAKHPRLLDSRSTTTPKVLVRDVCLTSPALDADSVAAEMVRDELDKLRVWYASLSKSQTLQEDARAA